MGVIKDTWDIGGQVLQSVRRRQERSHVEKVLSVMTEHKNWKRTDLAKLANISDVDALQALRVLQDADKVIPLDVDEEPKGTFWRRI
jgi:transcription initiation factor IIE alpha subunit